MTQQQKSNDQLFLEAVEDARHDDVRAFIAQGVNLEHLGEEPIHDPALVRKSKPNARGSFVIKDDNNHRIDYRVHEKTALYCAVANDDVEMVKVLLEAGANPDTPIAGGLHPFTIAFERPSRSEIIPLFIKYKANPNVRSPYGNGTVYLKPLARAQNSIMLPV